MIVCTACGQENPDVARFCLACGSELTGAAPGQDERRIVSVVFVDLVGFTARAEKLDPEDVQAGRVPYHEHAPGELGSCRGTREKVLCDALMAGLGPAA